MTSRAYTRKKVNVINIFTLMGTILIDDKEADKSLSRTDKQTKTLGERLRGGIKTAAKWGIGLVGAATAAGAAMFGLVNKATQSADAIAKGAEKVGVSTDFYQEMDYWASQNGISHEQMEKAVGRFNQRLGQAVNGNDKYATALQELGVNLDDVREGTLSTEDAYAQSISTLSEMENEQDKVNLATELFGTRMARDLLPALNDGSLSIDEAREKAQELGLVLSEDQLQASEAFQDSWDSIKRSLGTAVTQIGLDLMPMFQTLMDWVLENLPAIRETFSNVFDVIGNVISAVVGFIQENLIPRLQELWDWIAPNLPIIQQFFIDAFGTAKEVLYEVVEAIKATTAWFQEHWNIIQPILAGIAAGIVTFKLITGAIAAYGAITKAITAVQLLFNAALLANPIGLVVVAIGALVAAGVMLWKNWDVVKAKVSQLWSSITSAFQNIQSTVVSIVSNLVSSVLNFFTNMGTGILNTASNIFSSVRNVFTNILSFITGLGSSFLSAGRGLIENIVKGITGAIGKVTDAVKGVASKIRSFLPFSPAKEGPLSDLDKLDFDGPISDSIEGAEHNVQAKMSHLLSIPSNRNSFENNRTNSENSMIESLLNELIEAVRENKDFIIDGKQFAKVTGDYTDAEGGTRVRRLERGLAT